MSRHILITCVVVLLAGPASGRRTVQSNIGNAVADSLQIRTGGTLTLGACATFPNGETICNSTDDMFELQGVLGTDNTDFLFDLDGTHPVLSSPTDTRIELAEDVTITGDLTVTGDDIFATTVTSGAVWVADGTNYNPVVMSGDAVIGTTGTVTIQVNSVALGTDTTGNYCASITTSALTGLTGGAAAAEGTAHALAFDYTSTLAVDPALAASACVFGTTGLICECLTPDTFEALITWADVTADRTATFRDASGTVILSGDTFTGDVTATLDTDGSTALTIAADAVALGTDTTGNYAASVTTSALTGLTGGAVAAEGTVHAMAFDYTATLAADPGLLASACVFGTTGLICEGSGADGFEALITFTNPTADRTFTHRDASGTYIISGDTFTGDVTATLDTDGSTALTIAADAAALGTDTTGNYCASISTAATTGLTGGAAGSEGSTHALAWDYTATLAGNPALASGACVASTSGFACEGATANTAEMGLVFADPAADVAYTFPDCGADGNVTLSTCINNVSASMIADPTAGWNIPLTGWINSSVPNVIDANSAADVNGPDIGTAGATPTPALIFDDAGGAVDSDIVMYSGMAPPTWVTGAPTLRVRITKDASAGNTEVLRCATSIDNAAFGANTDTTITAVVPTTVTTAAIGSPIAAGDHVALRCQIVSDVTQDDSVYIYSAELRGTATQ